VPLARRCTRADVPASILWKERLLRALIFDPFAGISGDMTLGALLDIGLAETWLRDFIARMNVGSAEVRVERVRRCGIACTKVTFELPPEHAHRHLHHVLEIVGRADMPERAKRLATDAFQRLAGAEATVHGTTIEKVHFHEVGALDSILDVVCTMAALEELGLDAFFTRPVATGSGWIDITHGRFPVPAPATLRILQGVPVTGLDLDGECTTPTGAAMIAALTKGAAPPSRFVPVATGFGAGSRDPADRPNCLRVFTAEVADPSESLLLVQADVDDLPPEYVPAALDAMVAAGALDAVVVPVSMKKGRPGTRFEALAPEAALHGVLESMFRATSTLGARFWPVTRPALARREDVIEWRGQRIRRKHVTLPGGEVRAKPEYEDVARAAAVLGLTPWEVRAALERAGS
jgi:hypothetical protein